MSYLIIPRPYRSLLTAEETERGIKLIKDFFQQGLAKSLRLRRVTAPLFVLQGQGINDDLSGVERAVSFPVKDLETPAQRWFIPLQSGRGSPWPSITSGPATASILT